MAKMSGSQELKEQEVNVAKMSGRQERKEQEEDAAKMPSRQELQEREEDGAKMPGRHELTEEQEDQDAAVLTTEERGEKTPGPERPRSMAAPRSGWGRKSSGGGKGSRWRCMVTFQMRQTEAWPATHQAHAGGRLEEGAAGGGGGLSLPQPQGGWEKGGEGPGMGRDWGTWWHLRCFLLLPVQQSLPRPTQRTPRHPPGPQ